MARRKAPNNATAGNPDPYTDAITAPHSAPTGAKRTGTTMALRQQGGGLLQLRLGRAAQAQGLGAAFGLAFNAFLVYAASQAGTAQYFQPSFLDATLWLLPLFVGAVIGVDAVSRKWTPYRGYRSSRHFVLSLAGLVLAVLGMILVGLQIVRFTSLAIGYIMYPLSVTTISLVLLSMADTWQGWGSRKIVSTVAALTPAILMVFWVYFGIDPKPTPPGNPLLAMFFYFTMALAAEISGSMLHIIASSTATAEREILTASDLKLAQMQTSLKEVQKALEFRQRGLDEKEAIMEVDRKDLEDELARAAVQSSELRSHAEELDRREFGLQDFDKRVSSTSAQIDARAEQLKLREGDLSTAEALVDKGRKEIAKREAALTDREKELKRLGIEVTATQRDLDARSNDAAHIEDRLKKEDTIIVSRQKALLKKEKEVQLGESQIKLRSEQLDATMSPDGAQRIREMKDWEEKLLTKEKELGTLEVELKTLEDEVKERYDKATTKEKRTAKDQKHVDAKEKELVAREQMVSDKESAVGAARGEIDRSRANPNERNVRLTERGSANVGRRTTAEGQQAPATSNEGAANARQAALDGRQKKLDEMEARLRKEIDDRSRETREILSMRKELDRREQELTVKSLEFETKRQQARAAASTPGVKDMGRDEGLGRWQEELQARADELTRRGGPLPDEMAAKEQALRAQVQAGMTDGIEEVVIEEKKERVKSGTPRLDDLLYGGIPFNANLLFVGPPYVGKEVVILNFVAEGLKKGVPAIIITTSKPPVEIAKEMAPILPTFVEYEQLGLVHWIDCSGSTASAGKPTREKNTFRVDGPTDFTGILKVVNELDHDFKGKYPYFRLAFMTLSSCIGPDQGAAMNFVQKLVNRLRQTKAVAAYALERGMHTDQQVESLEHLLDGAIQFKSDKQKTMLQVVGLGESQTRDWVPYKHTNKAIMIGSFQLERIR